MRRHHTSPRNDWQKIVESQGMYYHTADGVPYWDESAYYEFTDREIDALEEATYALDQMCLAAVQHVLDCDLLDKFLIPKEFHRYIRDSWEQDERTVYGRFDLAYDGTQSPKLLEYNADTPTALLEAAVIQWHWLRDSFPRLSQFSSIHERLLEAWKLLANERPGRMYFASVAGCVEDYMTVSYLRDVAIQAGCDTAPINIEDIGWDDDRGLFTDKDENPIFSREGANIQVFKQGKLVLATDGPYDGPAIYQESCSLPLFEGKYYACIGSWIVDGWACGIGIREDESMVTGNLSRFVPHVF